MKKIVLLLCLLLACGQTHAQSSSSSDKALIEEFEVFCPIYILENYCNPKGFLAIRNQLLADERASNLRYLPDPVSGVSGDSILWFNYNKMYIGLEFNPRVKHLTNFYVFSSSKIEITSFGMLYAFLMGYIPEKSANADVDRYYAEQSSMNAVIVNLKPENLGKPPFQYRAICFVMQGLNFCQ
ncbi:hypothetical protein [Hymenobacter sp. 102]|uniref:hypothetical protein n=1 Tax=Hymenobacter sp. 102 TaxID=3403152 RepID=UPI003CF40512